MYLLGDELGHLRTLRIVDSPGPSQLLDVTPQSDAPKSSVSAISVHSEKVAVAYASGSVSTYTWTESEVKAGSTWKETRLKSQDAFVGLYQSDRGVYSCTSNGALRLVEDDRTVLGALPSRLCVWKLDPTSQTFAYGGNEVDVSLWNTERAFSQEKTESSSAKRKRDELFPGEVWRAKNIQTDNLGLRQPIRVTTLTYLPSSGSASPHIMAGTQLGDVRRYDTRARKPTSQWKDIAKTGGVKVLEKGLGEHEIFVGDHGCNLSAVDLRNGRIVYSYKGLSGAVTSVAPSSRSASNGRGGQTLVSVALDRYCRVHSTFGPPSVAGQNQDNAHKGDVLEKIFTTSVPTVVVWSGADHVPPADAEDDVWDQMENVDSEDDEVSDRRKRRRKQD
uniref:Ribosome biogenesis protein NSA1 n=1 Tax=Mycena chlorophos TaxID=658473 RepID=A0ABQ0M602_MYCCL|nr:predicted protein [Mycena chlorophos]